MSTVPPQPMLARLAHALPVGSDWVYEPKWDGFRALAQITAGGVELFSRRGTRLSRRFPELAGPLLASVVPGALLDGELLVLAEDGLRFEHLLSRLGGPRWVRSGGVAVYVPFDLLAADGADLRSQPLAERRGRLQRVVRPHPQVQLTVQTSDPDVARGWLEDDSDLRLEGVVAKKVDQSYRPGRREWVKVKRGRTLDCIVVGFRPVDERLALLVGLIGPAGLVPVGQTYPVLLSGHMVQRLRELVVADANPPMRMRWSQQARPDWSAVRPELTREITFTTADSIGPRHLATFVRWRPDKAPEECLLAPHV